jgi:hypothetical protein
MWQAQKVPVLLSRHLIGPLAAANNGSSHGAVDVTVVADSLVCASASEHWQHPLRGTR